MNSSKYNLPYDPTEYALPLVIDCRDEGGNFSKEFLESPMGQWAQKVLDAESKSARKPAEAQKIHDFLIHSTFAS
jgi:hypothetical protein